MDSTSDRLQSVIERTKSWWRALPDKKRYVEFLTALLSVPVLLTVVILNINNLKNQNQSKTASPTSPPPVVTIIQPPATTAPAASPMGNPSPTLPAQCTKAVGPVSITAPEEGDTVTGDPVCVVINRQDAQYCSVVWSYRINGGAWSDYTDSTICMYGLTPGAKKLDLRVKSLVSSDQVTLTRNFTVAGATPTPTPPAASSSGTSNP